MEGKKMATSKAQIRATSKYEKKAYFKTLVRFRTEDEKRIREAAGESLNGFIVAAVMEKLQKIEEAEDPTRERSGKCLLNN
jgi:hypothetical protein